MSGCKTEDDCPTPMWCRGKDKCPEAGDHCEASTDTEILEWLERNPLAITASAVIKSWGRKNWWHTAYGEHDTLREAVERCKREVPSS